MNSAVTSICVEEAHCATPRCAVCGVELGDHAFVDVLDTQDGGTFSLSCGADDEAHLVDLVTSFPLSRSGIEFAIGDFEWIARQSWASRTKLLNAVRGYIFREGQP